jgi:hypothetical protein
VAISLVTPCKDSHDESVHGSVDALLTAIHATQENNAELTKMVEQLNKGTKLEDFDQTAIGKTLAGVQSMQRDVMKLSMAAAKLSTFSILEMKGEGDDTQPVGFTITATQHAKLLTEVRELIKNKSSTYVDNCADILLTTFLKLPFSEQKSSERFSRDLWAINPPLSVVNLTVYP